MLDLICFFRQENRKKSRIHRRPAFYAATKQEFRENKKDLVFIPEYLLSKKPLQIDLLILKMCEEAKIKNEIGFLFEETNILECKGSMGSLSIDDFYKAIAYACLYKALQARTNSVPADTVSILIILDSYPRDLMKEPTRPGWEQDRKSVSRYFPCNRNHVIRYPHRYDSSAFPGRTQ